MKILNVAVIGAGAAGLCAARHIAARPNMKAVIYEQANNVGGAWFYTDETERDKNGLKVHSAMYKNLKTNLPKQVMAFPDFEFDEKFPSYMVHGQVQEYLESYCDHFDLRKLIQFETLVQNVKSRSENVWEITVLNLKNKSSVTREFDAVFVCNGHYAQPHIPKILGQENFKGLVIHSHSYRYPNMFANKRVVVLGCRSSGQDISLDIAKHAKSVIISHRTDRLVSTLPDNVSQAVTTSRFQEDGKTVVFEDGSQTEADAFVYCTGYEYNFPFLDESCEITVDNGKINHLYNHVINPAHPSMSFIGICARICPFPQFHFQVIYGLAALDGSMKLPSKVGMLKEIDEECQKKIEEGMPLRLFHTMGTTQWEYNNMLAQLAGVPGLHGRIEKLYVDVAKSRRAELCHYKTFEIELLKNGMYKLLYFSEKGEKCLDDVKPVF